MLQNKCARYWPEENKHKDYGKINVKNLIESSTAHYTLRELLVRMDRVMGERKVYQYHFQVKITIESNLKDK